MPRLTPTQPSRIRRFFGLKKLLVANVIAFALVAWGFSGEYVRYRRMEGEIDRLRQEASQLEQKNSELAEIGSRLSAGTMLEREARVKLNLRRPGEEVIVIRGDVTAQPEGQDAAARAAKDAEARAPNHVKWWRYFFR